ncbi:carnitine dehydratase [Mycobacterium colombiense]|uniref:CaiB/BaiF CoA transferase family protein n=1 Tax=Mycobacterium colombiense TaxID=339268 RepID=UPI0007EF4A58|nr:CaiB/BaiF CoA-transferase family protein [Mycobacterium colombiense]OBK68553.1 carnitine dehydratase [Mycobacterium colombiense]
MPRTDGGSVAMGPLNGVRVIELGGIGPAPFGCMMLADAGAEVVRVDRPLSAAQRAAIDDGGRSQADPRRYVPHRGRRSIGLDLKSAADRDVLLRLVERADVVVEGFRPGVVERLGIGPAECLSRNPRIVYGRMTGWGQTGPLASTAGHDINYIAVAGVLDNFRRTGERPLPPLNTVADMGGGGMMLAFGIAAALLHALRTGQGQVIDAAMVDGAAIQMATILGSRAQGRWPGEPGSNFSDTGAPSYEVYRCADGKFVAVGAIEGPFWAELLRILELPIDLPSREDPANWPEGKRKLADAFLQRTRDEWAARFDGTDACVSPVLSIDEAPEHPHAIARSSFVTIGGVVQPAPAPRFSKTQAGLPSVPPAPGENTTEILQSWGFGDDEIVAALRDRPL